MSIENPDKPNPWGRGDEFEKQLGEEEVRATRDRHADKTARQRALEEIAMEPEERFHKQLERAGGHIEETFELDGSGRIHMDIEQFNAAGSLLDATPGTQYVVPGKPFGITYLPEELMQSAKSISEKFPKIDFSFRDERPKRFSYTATLRKSEE